MSTNVDRPRGADMPTYTPAPTATGWIGWLVFAGVAAIVLGAFSIIQGLVAVFNHGYYLVTTSNLIVHVNFATWGWTLFGIGVAVVLAGIGVMTGAMWGRVLGIAVAAISAIVNLAFIPAFPVWGVIAIALDVVVIYALAVHGGEMKALREL